MTTPLPAGGVLKRASFTYSWAYSVDDPRAVGVAPMIFVDENREPLAVADAGGLYVVQGEDLVKAESWEVDWSEATISYRLP